MGGFFKLESNEKRQNSIKNLKAPWKKGQSGNPKGKKKGTKNISTYLKELLENRIETKDGYKETGAVIAYRMIQSAIKGDRHMIREILDRTEGRSCEQINDDSDKGGIVVLGASNDY